MRASSHHCVARTDVLLKILVRCVRLPGSSGQSDGCLLKARLFTFVEQ